MEAKRVRAYLILLLVLALLCTAAVLRLLHVDLGHAGRPSWGLVFVALLPAIKCGIDLFDRQMDVERRLLSVAALLPASLFLLSFYAPPATTTWLLVLAAVTLTAVAGAAFLMGRKFRTS